MKKFCMCISTVILFMLATAGASAVSNNFNTVLWLQTSAEYKAGAQQTYNAALKNIGAAIKDRKWKAALEQTGDCSKLPPAVVMDLDETVLDNGKYFGKVLLENVEPTPAAWDAWVVLKDASAVPGAVEFINEIRKKHVQVIFITNRACMKRGDSSPECMQKSETIENLAKIGVRDVSPEQVLFTGEREGWSSDKKSRREFVAKKYRIVMLFGDDLGDFLPGVRANITPQERERLVEEHKKKWGTCWFMVPNPVYGSWINILQEPKTQYIKAY